MTRELFANPNDRRAFEQAIREQLSPESISPTIPLVGPPIVGYTMYIPKGERIMKKSLIKHGNSLALVIDKPILEMLQITADTPLELTTNGDVLLVRPIRNKRRQRQLETSLEKINEKFGDDLQRLAK